MSPREKALTRNGHTPRGGDLCPLIVQISRLFTRTDQYFIPDGVRSRSAGWKCSGCEVTVRKWVLRSKRVYTCKCSLSVLGDKASPFTESEWHAFRVNALGRSIRIRSEMEGEEHGGKN